MSQNLFDILKRCLLTDEQKVCNIHVHCNTINPQRDIFEVCDANYSIIRCQFTAQAEKTLVEYGNDLLLLVGRRLLIIEA
jgi:hypothetical protein